MYEDDNCPTETELEEMKKKLREELEKLLQQTDVHNSVVQKSSI